MPLPSDLAKRRVVGHWTRFDGKPDAGTITLTPSTDHLYGADLDVVVTRVPITITLDKDGRITGKDNAPGWAVPTTDDPEYAPPGWDVATQGSYFTYELHVKLKSGYERTTDIEVKAAAEDLDLLSVPTAVPVSETTTLVTTSQINKRGGVVGLSDRGYVPDSLLVPRALGAVCFSWDDGRASQAWIADEADKRNQRHTFFVNSGTIGTSSAYLTSAQVLDLYQRGHEIGSHGVTHSDMTTLTPQQRQAEWDQSKTNLEVIVGAGHVRSYTYPFGNRTDATDQEAYLRYDNISFVTSGGNFQNQYSRTTQPFLSARLSIGQGDFQRNLARQLIQLAARQPVIVNLYGHNPDAPPGDITSEQVLQLMDLAQSLGVPCITHSQAFGGPMLVNGGFEEGADGLDGWMPPVVSSDGSSAQVVTDTPDTGLSGTRSLKLTSATNTGYAYVYQLPAVVPYQDYTLSARVRSSTTSQGDFPAIYLRLKWLDGLRDEVGTYATSSDHLNAPSWERIVVTATAPSNASMVEATVLVGDLTGTAHFDHVHLGPTAFGSFG